MNKIGYLDNNFQCQIQNEELDLDKRKIKHITRVHKHSPAHRFGIKAGDWLGDVNGYAPIDVELEELYNPQDHVNYMIYRQQESKVFLIQGKSLPLGIEVEYSSEAIIRRFEDGEFQDEEELYILWQRNDWSALSFGSRCFRGLDDLVSRLLSKFFKRFKYQGPAILTHGIALFELGKKQQGLDLIRQFYQQYMQGWTTEWYALTYFYLGVNEFDNGNAEGAHELFEASATYCRCPVLQKRLADYGVQVSLVPYWNEQSFPYDFSLPELHGEQHVKLSELLDNLADQELLYLCVMPSYRANSVYNDFLEKYDSVLSCFPQNTSPLYVITDVEEASEAQDWWLQNEKKYLAQGKPITLLYDEYSKVANVLEQNTSPNIYVLNKEGVILNSGICFYIGETWTWLHQAFDEELQEQDSLTVK